MLKLRIFPCLLEVRVVPLTKKGKKIKKNMEEEYGRKKGEEVFYASANKGRIKGVHRGKKGKKK